MEKHMEDLLQQAVKAINKQYSNEDYARKNPALVCSLLRAATSSYKRRETQSTER